MKQALIVGSLGFDEIFSVHGDIKNEIPLKNGKIEDINLMFTANNKKRYFGGTAGNIAYGLGLLGQNPLLFSVVGKDYKDEYEKHLKSHGVEPRVVIDEKGFSGTFYGISDQSNQQIGIWQPNSYGEYIEKSKISSTISTDEMKNVGIAIFSPGTGISTRNHMKEIRELLGEKVTIIFDPSQVLSIFYDDDLLRECLELADIVISNQTEISHLESIFNLSKDDVFKFGVKYVIETEGEKGSSVYSKNQKTNIPAIKPEKVIETTGAGDAYRAGLIFGLLNEMPVDESAKIGALLGSKNVEKSGGQQYKVDINEINSFL